MKLLIVEDEKLLSDSIASYLRHEHFICDTAMCYADALDKIGIFDYDCVLLDINLQDGSLVVIPELTYSPVTNLELRFRTPVLIGGKGTEYGAKQNDYRIDLRVRYYFELF